MKRDVNALVRFLAERSAMPYEWGRRKNDCASFANEAVRAQTGKTALGRLTWKDERSALKVIKSQGGMEKALDARFERVAPALAMRGDIAGVPDEHFGIHPMIVEGVTLCSPGDRGLKRVPRSAMTMAWSVIHPKKKKRV
jgi:hypothetical protein